jgi:hypothetical protein
LLPPPDVDKRLKAWAEFKSGRENKATKSDDRKDTRIALKEIDTETSPVT